MLYYNVISSVMTAPVPKRVAAFPPNVIPADPVKNCSIKLAKIANCKGHLNVECSNDQPKIIYKTDSTIIHTNTHTHTQFLFNRPVLLQLLQVRSVPNSKLWGIVATVLLQHG